MRGLQRRGIDPASLPTQLDADIGTGLNDLEFLRSMRIDPFK